MINSQLCMPNQEEKGNKQDIRIKMDSLTPRQSVVPSLKQSTIDKSFDNIWLKSFCMV